MKWLLILTLMVGCESEYRKRCRLGGGRITQINCATECNTYVKQVGDPKHPTYVPVTHCRRVCDDFCVGANPEANNGK